MSLPVVGNPMARRTAEVATSAGVDMTSTDPSETDSDGLVVRSRRPPPLPKKKGRVDSDEEEEEEEELLVNKPAAKKRKSVALSSDGESDVESTGRGEKRSKLVKGRSESDLRAQQKKKESMQKRQLNLMMDTDEEDEGMIQARSLHVVD